MNLSSLSMKRLLLVYHSQSGSTESLARAVLLGCQKELGVDTRILGAFNADISDLLWADGVIFGTPENFGYMSGALKDFFDRTFYLAEPQKINLPYGIFVTAGNDGQGAVREIQRIANGYPLRLVSEPLIVRGGYQREEHHSLGLDFGHAMAAGLSLGIF